MTERTWNPGDEGLLPELDESAYPEGAVPLLEFDPRTDGVGDGGPNELPPPSEEEIAAGVEYDRKHRERTIADPATPYAEDPADDQYHEDDEEKLTRVKMRPVTEDEEAQDNW